MTYILVYAFKYQSHSDKIKHKRLKDTFKDYFILFLINCFYMVDYVLPYYIFREDESGEEEEENYDNKVEDLFIADGFQKTLATLGLAVRVLVDVCFAFRAFQFVDRLSRQELHLGIRAREVEILALVHDGRAGAFRVHLFCTRLVQKIHRLP